MSGLSSQARCVYALDTTLAALIPHLSAAQRDAALGFLLLRADAPLLVSDLRYLALPGLHAFGLHTDLILLSEDTNAEPPLLRQRLQYRVSVPLLRLAGELPEPPEPPERLDALALAELALPEPTLLAAGLAFRQEGAQIVLLEEDGRERPCAMETLNQDFTHLLALRRGSGERPAARNRGLLLRWLAFADAYPMRLLTRAEEDAAWREGAAQWFAEMAGAGKRYLPLRLNRAAEAMAAGEIEESLYHLREGLLPELELPGAVATALLLEEETPLSPVETRELIYLARAGTPELRTLAARRLRAEAYRRDILRTLQQLCFDSHPWVRAAACGALITTDFTPPTT